MDTIKARLARVQTLTKQQEEVVVGSLLGDGHLAGTTRGFAFRVNHSIGQKEYVDWKYHILKSLTNSPPSCCHKSYYFRTVSHPYFDVLRQKFYVGKKKILPADIDQLMTALIISIWLMDDGSRDKRQLRFNSQSFTLAENKRLISILEAKFGIMATINRDKDKFRLRVSAVSMPCVRQLVAPFIIPSMQYKLSP